MDFLELAKKRCSVRKYKDQVIEKEKLSVVLEAGRVAPSACNKQPWHFVVVQSPEVVEALRGCGNLFNAPSYIVICGEQEKAWVRPQDGKNHCDIDLGITIDHMTLAAVDQDLATCWICYFEPKQCRELLQLPYGIEPVAILPIGYPETLTNPERHEAERRSLDELVHFDTF